ncbi:hypothetical protein [Acinetobacter lactucae]|uniref:hypothetical protein n=1 Tax=Acinetobacter lactucae TaxID=1785128 RepID=UPI0003DFA5BF|nr:hypothetical protein [Acinetobacter lactucae]ETR94561.1 hypothetical protein M211_2197 [Acinetobacter lactucae]
MKVKTLKEKIRDVVFWICAGGVIYLIVGYLMKTNWLSCPKQLPELYELIRDSLTLMAYFLAPAAAFILFSDWRLEHVEKSREKQVEDIYNSEQNLYSALFDLDSEIEDEESLTEEGQKIIEKQQKTLLNDIFKFENLLNDFDYEDEKSLKYKKLAQDILYQYKEMFYYTGLKYSSLLKINDPKQYNTQYTDLTDEHFIDRIQSMYEQDNENYHDAVGNAWKLRKDMKPLKSELMIKNKSPN